MTVRVDSAKGLEKQDIIGAGEGPRNNIVDVHNKQGGCSHQYRNVNNEDFRGYVLRSPWL